MLVRFIKNAPIAKADTLTCVRADGSTTRGEMPRQGILPHDAFHFEAQELSSESAIVVTNGSVVSTSQVSDAAIPTPTFSATRFAAVSKTGVFTSVETSRSSYLPGAPLS